MFFAHIFDYEIVDYKEKHDGMPLVAPQSWCRGGFIIFRIVESFPQQVVGKFSRLRQNIAAMDSSKVNPPVALQLGEVIFVDEFLGDIRDLDAKILRPIHWCGQV